MEKVLRTKAYFRLMEISLNQDAYVKCIKEFLSIILKDKDDELFDEVLLLTHDFNPLFACTYRNGAGFPSGDEIEGLALVAQSSKLEDSEYELLYTAEGSDFDIILRVKDFFIVINNTVKTITDLLPEGEERILLNPIIEDLWKKLSKLL